MRVLITGSGSSGSWQIRGVQVGQALGASVRPRTERAFIDKADVVVGVKRLPEATRQALRESKTPWIWDLVDFYPQPKCTEWGRSKATRWVREQIKQARPDGIIWPNRRMQEDCEVAIPSTVIYHHARPDARVNPIRTEVKTVGYEGGWKFVGEWQEVFERECASRGLKFVVNEGELADWDICVAVRTSEVNGYCQRHWKSNVKLANAHGTGTPFIGGMEASYRETGTGDEVYIRTPEDVGPAIDALLPYERRKEISTSFRAKALPLEVVAQQYREFLHEFV